MSYKLTTVKRKKNGGGAEIPSVESCYDRKKTFSP